MAQDRPTAQELIEAVREFIERDVMAALDGQQAFHARVAANVLAMVERELAMGPASDAAELVRLEALLGRAGTLAALNAELARQIRDGALDLRHSEVLEHLRRTSRDKLAITNPRYMQGRPRGESAVADQG